MKKLLSLMIGLLLVCPFAMSGELETELAEAREKLDEAARQLAQIHKRQFAEAAKNEKAMLGILLGDKNSEGNQPKGVELYGVTPGGGADEAGLKAGDLIISIDSVSLQEAASPMRALVEHMQSVEPGEVVMVEYVRSGETGNAAITTQAHSAHLVNVFANDFDFDFDFDGLDFTIADGARIAVPHASRVIEKSHRLMPVSGDLAQYFGVDEGVLVIDPPQRSQLKAGDIILAVAGQPVQDVASASRHLADITDSADVEIKRAGIAQTVVVGADEFDHHMSRVIRIDKRGDEDGEVEVEVFVEKRQD